MKIYLIKQSKNTGYDTYDSAIVCAEDETEAKRIIPFYEENNSIHYIGDEEYSYDWVTDVNDVTCIEIGEANNNQTKGVILASFNAG